LAQVQVERLWQLQLMKMNIIRSLFKQSRGSAIAEFVIFTLPFFTVFLILVNLTHQKAIAISESDNLARQAVRAFVTSPGENLALPRANQVIDIYRSHLSDKRKGERKIMLEITCQKYPCFTPGNLITATVSIGPSQKASASEYVDLWR